LKEKLTCFSYSDIIEPSIMQGASNMNWYLYMTKKRPSFIIGIARIFDFFSVIREPYEKPSAGQLTGLPDDEEALRGDWHMVGQDMAAALKRVTANEPSQP
jgi:hypothetical protein